MSGRIDSRNIEENQRTFLVLFMPIQMELGEDIRNLCIGQENKHELSSIYNKLHNLRHLSYSVGFRHLGEFLNFYERLIRMFKDRCHPIKESELMLINKAHFSLMEACQELNLDINSKLKFIFNGEPILQLLKSYSDIPPVRKLNIITLGVEPGMDSDLVSNGLVVTSVKGTEEMFNEIKKKNYDCILVDLDSGISPSVVLKLVKGTDPRLKIVMVKEHLELSSEEMTRVDTKVNLLLSKRFIKESSALSKYLKILLTELL